MNINSTELPRLSCPSPNLDRYSYLHPQSINLRGRQTHTISYFFALDLRECLPLLPRLIGSVVNAIRILGPHNCALSVIEGMSPDGTADVLSALRRSGAPYRLSPGRLVAETMVTSGTMTNRVDRLAERGLVERGDDPNDRRGVLVSLTPQGRRTVDAALEELLERERSILASLPAQEAARLADTLRVLARNV